MSGGQDISYYDLGKFLLKDGSYVDPYKLRKVDIERNQKYKIINQTKPVLTFDLYLVRFLIYAVSHTIFSKSLGCNTSHKTKSITVFASRTTKDQNLTNLTVNFIAYLSKKKCLTTWALHSQLETTGSIKGKCFDSVFFNNISLNNLHNSYNPHGQVYKFDSKGMRKSCRCICRKWFGLRRLFVSGYSILYYKILCLKMLKMPLYTSSFSSYDTRNEQTIFRIKELSLKYICLKNIQYKRNLKLSITQRCILQKEISAQKCLRLKTKLIENATNSLFYSCGLHKIGASTSWPYESSEKRREKEGSSASPSPSRLPAAADTPPPKKQHPRRLSTDLPVEEDINKNQRRNLYKNIIISCCSFCFKLYNLNDLKDFYYMLRLGRNLSSLRSRCKMITSVFLKIIFVYFISKHGDIDTNIYSTMICEEKMSKNIFCKTKNTSRLVLVWILEMGLGSIPLKQRSRDTSENWLCGPNLKKNSFNLRYNIAVKLNSIITLTKRHCIRLMILKTYHDVEKNPGPLGYNKKHLDVFTLNCRGLGKINKFRLVLAKVAELLQLNPDSIFMLQETMVKNDHYLKLAWKGTYAITPGNGNSQGCITLANHNVKIERQINYEQRGHYIEIKGLTCFSNPDEPIAICNIYAPNGYSNVKKVFYENIFDQLENSQCANVILAGDFNLTFGTMDRFKRNTSIGETNIANFVVLRTEEIGLKDAWVGYEGMTWKKGVAMSRLDRIFTRLIELRQTDISTNWTFCDSDHALVHARFEILTNRQKGAKICRLDPQVVQDRESLLELRQYLEEQLATLDPNTNPHRHLEFAKMTIRTKALQLGKKLREADKINLQILNDDIIQHERLLVHASTANEEEQIMLHLERITNEKNKLLEKQGKNLAWKAKTRWYNEGEKSNKYFLNLLKSNTNKMDLDKLNHNGMIITDQNRINELINDYYYKLYNSNLEEVTPNDYLHEMFQLRDEEVAHVNAPITLGELWSTLKPLKDTAPGPDGISHIYLKKLWDIIGPLILKSWQYALVSNEKTYSHERSYLRLIPKVGKDPTQLTNWRPITLSNCDHKLITRTYNNRLVKVLGKYIINTQTAYLQNRNISDNIRFISTAIQLANNEPDIDGSIIALDAKKAFDTVNHDYLSKILDAVRLHTFVPIFKLLYNNLSNEVLVNGTTIGMHPIRNGVKQGDALSCTLFILAIEPLIRNINKNETVRSIESTLLQFQWPKALGYADDITCIVKNEQSSKQAIFDEYERFSKISGLVLNADKTEIYNFSDRNHPGLLATTNIKYLGQNFHILPTRHIKINGVTLCQNRQLQKQLNCMDLIVKMDRHFSGWSKRHLTLLGKIQIYKTFGLSQFLYHLANFEPTLADWKLIKMKINKFLWNKKYENNPAPHRIKRETLLTPINKGGFGMIDLTEVAVALRLRRHFSLIQSNIHPLSMLIWKLIEGTGYLSTEPVMDLDEILQLNMGELRAKRLKDCGAPEWQLESDLILHENLLYTHISEITRPRKKQSNEFRTLQRRGIATLNEVIRTQELNLPTLRKMLLKDLFPVINVIARYYRNIPIPNRMEMHQHKIKGLNGRWVDPAKISSKMLREILFGREMVNPKITLMENDEQLAYFSKLSKVVNVANKSKILRLLQGDVYCNDRLYRFGMTESDRCKRCFEKETISHLLSECMYTKAVYGILNINSDDVNEILGVHLGKAALEIRCDIISYIVFRQQSLLPETLVRTTLEKYAKGVVNRPGVQKVAKVKLRQIFGAEVGIED